MANTTDFRLSLGRYTASFWPCSVAQERSWALLRFKKDQGTLLLSGGEEQGHITKDSRQYCLILGNTSTTSLPVQVTLHMASLDNLCVWGGEGGLCIYLFKEINSEYSLEGLVLKLKLQHFGHLMGAVNSLEKTLMLGKIEGKGEEGGRG